MPSGNCDLVISCTDVPCPLVYQTFTDLLYSGLDNWLYLALLNLHDSFQMLFSSEGTGTVLGAGRERLGDFDSNSDIINSPAGCLV